MPFSIFASFTYGLLYEIQGFLRINIFSLVDLQMPSLLAFPFQCRVRITEIGTIAELNGQVFLVREYPTFQHPC